MLKRVRIRLVSERLEMMGDLFAGKPLLPRSGAEWQRHEMMLEGRYHDDGTRVSVSYEESELSGMEGSRVTISFHKSERGMISMLRTGSVKTALVFEQGRRHHCVYQTPYAPFEVCVHTEKVQNELETKDTLYLDYVVELKGADAERTRMTLSLLPVYDKPKGL